MIKLHHLPTGIHAFVDSEYIPKTTTDLHSFMQHICQRWTQCTSCLLCPWSHHANPKAIEEFEITRE